MAYGTLELVSGEITVSEIKDKVSFTTFFIVLLSYVDTNI